MGKQLATFPDLCGLVEGGTAYNTDTNTFYALLSCAEKGDPAFEVKAFDLKTGKSSVILSMGVNDGPRRLGWSKGTGLIGVTDTSVVSIANKKTTVLGTGRIGNPASHTFAIKESVGARISLTSAVCCARGSAVTIACCCVSIRSSP